MTHLPDTQKLVTVSRPSPWGNPYVLGQKCRRCGELHALRGSTIRCFTAYVKERLEKEPNWLAPLAGKTLVCAGCVPNAETCHARVLERMRPLRVDQDFY